MKARTASRLAWSLFSLGTLLAALTLVLGVVRGRTGGELSYFLDDLSWFLSLALFVPVGSLIASKHPRNPVGWILLVIGLCEIVSRFSFEYAAYSLVLHPGSLPGGSAMAWVSACIWPFEISLLPFVLLLFPNGTLLARHWKWVGWVPIGWLVVFLGYALALWPYRGVRFLAVEGSFGVSQLATAEAILFTLWPVVLLCVVASLVSLILRFRRSRGEERQQLKWLAFAATLGIASVVVSELLMPLLGIDNAVLDQVSTVIGGPGVIAIAAGIAIIRYRLYDIDFLINRTLVYGALTALLVLVYAAGVVGLGGALRRLFGQENNNLAVAASTLAVAALFRPARTSIQRLIDRRFYRRKYNATQTLDSFSARLREEIELDALTADLMVVIRDTMQPAHVSLWLRPPAFSASGSGEALAGRG